MKHTMDLVGSRSDDMMVTGRVLLAEDNQALADLLVWEFDDADIMSDHCINGSEALQLLEQRQYCCLVTDLFMPDMNGIELIKRTRELGYTLPIVVISAMKTSEYEAQLKPYDIAYFFSKPLQNKELALLFQLVKNV